MILTYALFGSQSSLSCHVIMPPNGPLWRFIEASDRELCLYFTFFPNYTEIYFTHNKAISRKSQTSNATNAQTTAQHLTHIFNTANVETVDIQLPKTESTLASSG